MGSDKTPLPAQVEDFDEEQGTEVRGTQRSASTKTSTVTTRDSPRSKEKKKGAAGAEKPSRSSKSTPEEVPARSTEREKDSARQERKKSKGDKTASASRGASKVRGVAFPPTPLDTDRDARATHDPAYYGISPLGNPNFAPASAAPEVRPNLVYARPRPYSYYGAPPAISYAPSPAPSYPTGPPPARSAYFDPRQPNAPYYSPPSPVTDRAKLSERFATLDPLTRSVSAAGFKERPAYFDSSDYDPAYEPHTDIRRRSIQIPQRSKAEMDQELMPPPALPRPRADHGRTYSEEERLERRASKSLYKDVQPARPSMMSRGLGRHSYEETGRIMAEPFGRRRSYYEEPARNSYEDVYRDAAKYQQEVAGPTVNLTAAALREQQRTATSSRSTRSSGSRDESDFRRSATTRTTSSIQDGDDMTIKLKGNTILNINGTEIKSNGAAELTFIRRKSVSGSERSGSLYGGRSIEDRRSARDTRPVGYIRSSSKSGRRAPPSEDSWF